MAKVNATFVWITEHNHEKENLRDFHVDLDPVTSTGKKQEANS
jgi:hypothetical protein